MCYIQAMPMMWRVLYTLENIIEQEGVEIGVSELSRLYNIVSHGSYLFLFKHKPSQPHLILKTTKNDTHWRNKFFFVRRDSIPDGKDLPKKWITQAISLSHIQETPATKERIVAFWKLDLAVRTFQANTKDSQEISSGSYTMSSASKSSKSASRFSVSDLDAFASSKAIKKELAASPSILNRKVMSTRGKVAKKRKTTEPTEGLPLIQHQFEEYVSEKFAEIQMLLNQHLEEAEQKNLDFQKMFLAKDKKISSLEKDLNLAQKELVLTQIMAQQEKAEVIKGAKLFATIAMLKIKLQMAKEAEDPAFDGSAWDKEAWR
ncbi:hypothetical protein HanHA300_Chr06g0217031 [Helianthus annuus]|nr:hypothetical protein HanHA300_Chr06g0217031 [Helianthus annuus]